MSTLDQVIQGLSNGNKYRRPLESGGEERLTPTAIPGQVKHVVASEAGGGSGGSAELDISTLGNGRWANEGWELYT